MDLELIKQGNIFEEPLQMAFEVLPDENGKFNIDPEERMYTLFIFFIDGYDQEKTFKFAVGQTAVREYIIEHVDVIDFEKSKISSWATRPYDYDGFLSLVQFMHYLDTITDEDGNKWFQDDFDIQEYLESQVEIDSISEVEKENYDNAISMIMNGSILQDITRLEEEGEEYDV